MEVKNIEYFSRSGWSETLPPCDGRSTLILVFFDPELRHDPRWLNDLVHTYPNAIVAGCSGAGCIQGSSVVDDRVCVAVARFQSTQLKFTSVRNELPENSFRTGQQIAQALKADQGQSNNWPKLVFVLSEGLCVNGSLLANGLNSILPEGALVTGGLAADGARFKETFVINNGKIESGFVTAVGFYGDELKVTFGSRGGWDIFGPERNITRSEGNILLELDGRPALDIYREYLGERAKDLPSSGLLFPLKIRSDHQDTRELVRTILAVDEERKALIFAGDLPQGWLAQMMHANFNRLVDGASDAATMAEVSKANNQGPAGDILAIAVSCVGRRLVLRDRIEEEVEATLQRFPPRTQQIGFYSYGELSPYGDVMNCELHNQTMTLTTLTEN